MVYKKYGPDKILEEFVECYFLWEGDSPVPIDIESPPNGLCSLVFNYRDNYSVSNTKYVRQQVPNAFITGQALGNYTLHLFGQIGVVGIAFRPATIFHFFGIPMYGLTDERIGFEEIAPVPGKELYHYICKSDGPQEKIRILENYLLQLLKVSQRGTTGIIRSANKIFESKGQITIHELLDSACMSQRNFERTFLEEVGVGPKTYARIRRFGYTCSLNVGNREANLMDMLNKGGYYDQSHFIKDFKYFSGRTPRRYVKTNVELANYVDGISLVERRLSEGK